MLLRVHQKHWKTTDFVDERTNSTEKCSISEDECTESTEKCDNFVDECTKAL